MKILVLFFIAFIFLLTIFLGYFLSKNIINQSELLVFWMLYIITISTVMTIFCSIYINYDIRNLKGPPGEQGEKGDEGKVGEDGICESDCKDKIPYKTILNAIEMHLYILEEGNKDTSVDLEERDSLLKKELDRLQKLNENDKKNKSEKVEDTPEMKKLTQMYSNIYGNQIDESKIIKLENPFFKETIKRITQSDEFKQLEPVRGNVQLLDYVKFIFLTWVDLIYKQNGINYFKTIGAENDLEKLGDNNPYNEIKKYDIYYWGFSDSFKPKINEKKNLFGVKKELKEGFKTFNELENPIKTINEKEKQIKNEPKKLKLLRTNDYMFAYNDKGTYIEKSIKCYRPKTVKHQGEYYYSMGDICVNETVKTNKRIFGNRSSSVSDGTYEEKPNRDAILVSGDVKKPLGYERVWDDWHIYRSDVHAPFPFGADKDRHGKYKGYVYKLKCPSGYKGLGVVASSTKNVPKHLIPHTDATNKYRPKGTNIPVCLPNECVEKVENKKSYKEIWNTDNSTSDLDQVFGVRKQDQNVKMYNFTDTTNFVSADHSNSYNLSDMSNNRSVSSMYKIKQECITKEDALPYYNNKHNKWKNKDRFENKLNLEGDDFQSPTLIKEDKTGERGEDKFTMYISVKNDKDAYLDLITNSKLKNFIKKYDNKFYEKNSYTNADITALQTKIEEIKKNIKTYIKKDLQIAIGFFDSLPKNMDKYKPIKDSLETLYQEYQKKHSSKIKDEDNDRLGLGWIKIPKKELDNDMQSVHNFLYIDDRGILETKTGKKILFNKISPGIFTLKQEYNSELFYLFIDKDKIFSELEKKPNLNLKKYHFILSLENDKDDKGNSYYIKSILNDKYLDYNTDNTKFILSDNKYLFTLKKF